MPAQWKRPAWISAWISGQCPHHCVIAAFSKAYNASPLVPTAISTPASARMRSSTSSLLVEMLKKAQNSLSLNTFLGASSARLELRLVVSNATSVFSQPQASFQEAMALLRGRSASSTPGDANQGMGIAYGKAVHTRVVHRAATSYTQAVTASPSIPSWKWTLL
jgi:hypothetical protein